MKHKSKIFKKNYFIIFLVFFSIALNQFYGYKGILPIDSFLIFNSGFDILNGYYPFKDYWTIKEPFIDLLQAILFKFFGVSWFVYVLHASLFNCLITLTTFFTLRKFNLEYNHCFLYSLSVAILTYPTAGTPFSDHHTLILCTISFYCFILAIKENSKLFWFLTPLFLGFSFMSKQAPTLYFTVLIILLSIFFLVFSKKYQQFLFAIFGFFSTIIIFFIILFLADIKLNDFYFQYYLYPKSLGESRLDWLLPVEFQRFFWRFKIQYLSISVLVFILFKKLFSRKKLLFVDTLIILGVISFCLITIVHQLMTINAIFIYCLIPIFCSFSHIFYKKYFSEKYVNIFLVLLTVCSTVYYFSKYVHNRTFMDLRNVNFDNAIDGKIIDPKLSNIKWITMFYPENPLKEVENIKLAIKVLKEDQNNKMLITDYQFISVFLNQYDFSVTRFWYDFHGYPQKNSRYFHYWEKFVLNHINNNNIKSIYVLKPLHGEKKPLENILKGCYQKFSYSEVFYKLNLENC